MGARLAHDLDWHLIECPDCAAANAANADTCWQCERPLARSREATASSPKAAASSRAQNDEPAGASRTHRRATWIAGWCAALVTAVTAILWWQDASRTDGATHAQQTSRTSPTDAAPGRTRVDTERPLGHAVPSDPDASIGRSSSDAYRALGLVGGHTDAERDKRASKASESSASSARSGTAVECTPAMDAMGLCSRSPDRKQTR